MGLLVLVLLISHTIFLVRQLEALIKLWVPLVPEEVFVFRVGTNGHFRMAEKFGVDMVHVLTERVWFLK